MRALEAIFQEASDLGLDGAVADLMDELLQRVLDIEGPPPHPIEGISKDYRRAFIRTLPTESRPLGTPVGVAETWRTDTWRCLLMELPSRAMARPKPSRHKDDDTDTTEGDGEKKKRRFLERAEAVLDSKSSRFQTKITDACRCLGLDQSYSEAAVLCMLGSDRTFMAWRERLPGETFNAMLRGDVDNYTKNCLDGLQKARIISNDHGVFRLAATKPLPDEWLTPPPALAIEVQQEALRLRDEMGLPFDEVKQNLILSHAQMAQIFPDYKTPKELAQAASGRMPGRPGRKPAKEYSEADLAKAVQIAETKGLREAKRETGVPMLKIKAELESKLGSVPTRAGRKAKVLPASITKRIQELAQDGKSIEAIYKALQGELEMQLSRRKIREVLNVKKRVARRKPTAAKQDAPPRTKPKAKPVRKPTRKPARKTKAASKKAKR